MHQTCLKAVKPNLELVIAMISKSQQFELSLFHHNVLVMCADHKVCMHKAFTMVFCLQAFLIEKADG